MRNVKNLLLIGKELLFRRCVIKKYVLNFFQRLNWERLSKMLIKEDEKDKEKYGIEYDSFFENNLFHQKLFTIKVLEDEAKNDISDTEVVKILVD